MPEANFENTYNKALQEEMEQANMTETDAGAVDHGEDDEQNLFMRAKKKVDTFHRAKRQDKALGLSRR